MKRNALVISGILLVALGLMGISYYTFCRRVDERYEAALKKAADACANNVDADELRYFWNAVHTEEFPTQRNSVRFMTGPRRKRMNS